MAAPSFGNMIGKRLWDELRPVGFRKDSKTFTRPMNDCFQIVDLQKSQRGPSFTVNFGVYSTRLEPLEKSP